MARGWVSRFNHEHLDVVVWSLRVVVGCTFIISGLSKVIDEWGFVYKIEQYLSIWDMAIPRTLVLVGAILLSGAEFAFGLLLLTGCYRRVVAWLLGATMAFMLPLTFYIMVYNPVSDCGCFGDFVKISNAATFAKNVVLSAAILYLIKYNRRIRGIYLPYCQWIVAFMGGLYALIVALVGYNVQPMVDFRPFPVGSRLAYGDSGDGENEVLFIYEKNGEKVAFTADELPDSTWTYAGREESAVASADRGGDISVFDGDEDITQVVLHGDGEQLIVLVPDMRRADISYTYLINELNRYMDHRGGEMFGILATDNIGVEEWVDYSMARYPCYSADDTSIKELVRGNVGLVYVKDGTIKWKRNLWSVPTDILTTTDNPLAALVYDGGKRLFVLSLLLVISLMALGAIQSVVLALRDKLMSKKRNESPDN